MAASHVTCVQVRADRPPVLPPTLLLKRRIEETGADAVAPSAPKRPKKRQRLLSAGAVGAAALGGQWLTLAGVAIDEKAVAASSAVKAKREYGQDVVSRPPPQPRWPSVLGDRGPSLYSAVCKTKNDMLGAEVSLRALRLSLAAGVEDFAWLDFARGRLRSALAVLAVASPALAEEVRAFEGSVGPGGRRKQRGTGAAAPAALSSLAQRAALDRLHFALWEISRKQGQPLEHPVRLAVEAQDVALSFPGVADAIRTVFALESLSVARDAWGLRGPWLRAEGKDGGRPWKPGACSLLQMLRARWCEGESLAVRARVDAADKKVRRALLDWQSGGRDCGARWLAFVVPNAAVLDTLAKEAGETGVVELGAGNGYWAGLLSKQGVRITALDVAPPELAPLGRAEDVLVQRGTADDLARSDHKTLLLCMPPPGEEGCCTAALDHFSGPCVVYVGEWASGMTGTRAFHAALLQRFELALHVPLPCWPKMRVEAFFFRQREPTVKRGANRKAGQETGPRSPSPLACDVCGRPASGPCGDLGLWRCPWSRQFCVCSEGCYQKGAASHEAVLRLCFCAASVSERPPLSLWEPCDWLEFGEAGDGRRWAALKEATPQDEPRSKRGAD